MTGSPPPPAPDAGIGTPSLPRALARSVPLVLVIVAAVAAVMWLVLSSLPLTYVGQARVLVAANDADPNADPRTAAVLDRQVALREAAFIRSPAFARIVTTETLPPLATDAAPVDSFRTFLSWLGFVDEPTMAFANRLDVHPVDESRVVAVDFASSDPAEAARGADAVAETYVAERQASASAPTADAIALVRSAIADLQAKLDRTDTMIARLRSDGLSTAAPEPLVALERESADLRTRLDIHRARLAQLAGGSDRGETIPGAPRIVAFAAVPVAPVFPRVVPMTLFAAAIAALLSLVVVAARHRTRSRSDRKSAWEAPRTGTDAAPAAGSPIVANGRSDRRRSPDFPTFAPRAAGEDAEDTLSRMVEDVMANSHRRILVVTAGPAAGERASIAAALARLLARTDRRTMLVDLHPEDRAASVVAGEQGAEPGFADLIAGDASFAGVITRDRLSRAHIIRAGRRRAAREDFAAPSAASVFAALVQTYDYLVLDVPEGLMEALLPEADMAVVVSVDGPFDSSADKVVDGITAVSSVPVSLLSADAFPSAAEVANEPDTRSGEAA
ncbi:hypothetical protein [Bauldia sp.]|uniref:hypothetical protein n=1 Tax=Bauldia sp. TaxID=2575872 RepID=UPI003BAA6BF4